MSYDPANPIIVQSDKSVFEVNNPRYEEARDALARFADLEKSPEHIHTYRITPLSLWNAASAGYMLGASLEIRLLEASASAGTPFGLRHYQQEAVDVFYAARSVRGGSGVIVMPCGAGKTIAGLGILSEVQSQTPILTPSIVTARQWIREILDKTTVPAEAIGEYSGEINEIKPITVTTYQVLTSRPDRLEDFPHFSLFKERDWGLIFYSHPSSRTARNALRSNGQSGPAPRPAPVARRG